MIDVRRHTGALTSPIDSLEGYFRDGGVTIIQAAFAHSFFIEPETVRAMPTRHPNRARTSGDHWPGKSKGDWVSWQGQEVRLDGNYWAQKAWEWYARRKKLSGTGYGVRHIWGHPWHPDAYTAGWNLCYMPFWAGMLTENQHKQEQLAQAIRQASWDLYFRNNPVCVPPDFVQDPGLDLAGLLGSQPVLVVTEDAMAAHDADGG